MRTPSVNVSGGSLSGGNQQKMVVAREFSRPIQLLIAAQPTRGIDVGSIEFIHQQIVSKRDEGIAVLLVSSELDEIMALADRIAVMYKGEVIGVHVAGAPRRGRSYSTAPKSLQAAIRSSGIRPSADPGALPSSESLTPRRFDRYGDSLRRQLTVAKVVCLVGDKYRRQTRDRRG